MYFILPQLDKVFHYLVEFSGFLHTSLAAGISADKTDVSLDEISQGMFSFGEIAEECVADVAEELSPDKLSKYLIASAAAICSAIFLVEYDPSHSNVLSNTVTLLRKLLLLSETGISS